MNARFYVIYSEMQKLGKVQLVRLHGKYLIWCARHVSEIIFIRYAHNQTFVNLNILKVLESKYTKGGGGLNMIAKIS